MAVGLAELIIVCILLDWFLNKFGVPGLVGMLLLGILFGPYGMGWLSQDLLNISQDLRLIALIVILLRAGLELSKKTLAKVGVRVILLSFLPAVFEGAAITAIAPQFLDISYFEAAILGAVLAAVSPAVVVPLMIEFIDKRMGVEKGIPTLVLAASSIDDVFVIVIYSILIGMYVGEGGNILWHLSSIPLSMVTGIGIGALTGIVLYKLFDRYNPRATKRALAVLGVSIIFVKIEHLLEGVVPFASLICVMAIGFIILERREKMAHELSAKFSRIWVFAEIILFTMVGTQVNIRVALVTGLAGLAVISIGLIARSIGSYLSLVGSELNAKERFFVVISYIPKATVQAAIGAAPLAAMKAAGMDIKAGEIILAVAVLSILFTAPLGAWAIRIVGSNCLEVSAEQLPDSLKAAIESDEHGEEII